MLYVFIIGLLLILFCGWIADMAVESEWIFIIGAIIGFLMVCISAVYGVWYLCTSPPPEKPRYSITVMDANQESIFIVEECTQVATNKTAISYYVNGERAELLIPAQYIVSVEPLEKSTHPEKEE